MYPKKCKPSALLYINDAIEFVENGHLESIEIITIRKGIELLSTKELIGSVMYGYIANKKEECEIGYSIGSQYWGQGLGTEIVQELLQTLRNNTAIKGIIARSNKENLASIKILTKLGFKPLFQNRHPDNILFHKSNE